MYMLRLHHPKLSRIIPAGREFGSSVWVRNNDKGQSTNQEASDYDVIGPPDPVSNIRPIRVKRPSNRKEKEFQRLQLHVFAFNHEFWKRHNKDFQECKARFIQQSLKEKAAQGIDTDAHPVTASELSKFYKEFLDEKFKDHMEFSKNWLKLNCALTWLSLKVKLSKFVDR